MFDLPDAHALDNWISQSPCTLNAANAIQAMCNRRVLIEAGWNPEFANRVVLAGGTPFQNHWMDQPSRHSEDLDFWLLKPDEESRQIFVDTIRNVFQGWGVKHEWRRYSSGTNSIVANLPSPIGGDKTVRLKVELFLGADMSQDVQDASPQQVSIDTDWFQGAADIQTLDALTILATKVVAATVRNKPRDWSDLQDGIDVLHYKPETIAERIVNSPYLMGGDWTPKKARKRIRNIQRRKKQRGAFQENLAQDILNNTISSHFVPARAFAECDKVLSHVDHLLKMQDKKTSSKTNTTHNSVMQPANLVHKTQLPHMGYTPTSAGKCNRWMPIARRQCQKSDGHKGHCG